eukprot:859941-Rhodomonas_salina.1
MGGCDSTGQCGSNARAIRYVSTGQDVGTRRQIAEITWKQRVQGAHLGTGALAPVQNRSTLLFPSLSSRPRVPLLAPPRPGLRLSLSPPPPHRPLLPLTHLLGSLVAP